MRSKHAYEFEEQLMLFEDQVCLCGLDGLESFMKSSFMVMRESCRNDVYRLGLN